MTVEGEVPPNELFENKMKSTLFAKNPQLDKYSVAAMLLLNRTMPLLSTVAQVELMNALSTEYPDHEFREMIEEELADAKQLDASFGYKSRVQRSLVPARNLAMIAFERKREGAEVEILREGQQQQDESTWFRKILGIKDEE